jgi:WD40 repeat protein
VSKNNRVLERHDAVHGAYWRTYDFDAVVQNLTERDLLLPDRRNIFAYPLGPGGTDNTFQHAGGEVIFNLPNGLHAFLLVNAENVRIDKGPTAIVSDPRRPDRAVEPGVSCMSCHVTGILQKSDQVRDHVAKNAKAFSRNDAELIRALYPPEERMRKLMEEDAERYRNALEKTGNRVSAFEPVSTLTLKYEADVDLPTAAAEMGLRPEAFLARVVKDELVSRNLGGLKVSGGTVSRQVIVQSFGDMVRALRLGSVLQPGATGQGLPDNTGEVDPLEGASNQVNGAAFSADRRRALLASADKSVRLHDVEAGRDVRRFVGHTASVWSVAFSPDSRLAASGSADRTVRLWDVADGTQLRVLEGHGGVVLCVAFSPDGKQMLTAALDHSVILWDVETGKEVRRLDGVAQHIGAVVFAPSGREAVLCADNLLHLVDLRTGKEVRAFEGHKDAVTAAAFSPDGRQLVSAADDGTVRLWDVASGRVARSFVGHDSFVKAVAVSADGKQVLSGGTDATVRLWDLASGRELRRFPRHTAPLLTVEFAADGRSTVSASSDADVRIWELVKGAPTPEPSPSSEVGPPQPQESARELRPVRVIGAGGTVGNLHLSPNRRWLYYLYQGRLARVDTTTLKRTEDLPLEVGTELLTLTPDGKTLVALKPEDEKSRGECKLFMVDAAKWEVRKKLQVDFRPYDLAADDRGRVYLSGGRGDWTDVAVVDAARGTVARWGGVWNRSFVRLSADQKRLYVSTQGVTPGVLEALVVPERVEDKPAQYRSPAVKDHALGGEFVVTPDNRFVLCRSGVVLRAAAGADNDLKYETTLPGFLAAAVDAEAGAAYLCGEDGSLRQYSYPDFKPKGVYRLPGVGYQATVDGKQGRLYVAVFDPKTLTARHRVRESGEIHVFEVGSQTTRRP